jgi:hypothetical protein
MRLTWSNEHASRATAASPCPPAPRLGGFLAASLLLVFSGFLAASLLLVFSGFLAASLLLVFSRFLAAALDQPAAPVPHAVRPLDRT